MCSQSPELIVLSVAHRGCLRAPPSTPPSSSSSSCLCDQPEHADPVQEECFTVLGLARTFAAPPPASVRGPSSSEPRAHPSTSLLGSASAQAPNHHRLSRRRTLDAGGSITIRVTPASLSSPPWHALRSPFPALRPNA
eukprot:2954845-Rhodomonas_salina.1